MRLPYIYCMLVLSFIAHGYLGAQDASKAIQASLIGHPLYLRGLWVADKLSFDSSGHLLSESRPGSLTLSGIDVRNVSIHGGLLTIHGERVALVANSEGRLERHKIENVTIMFATLQKKFIAHEDINLTVQADANGSFDKALKSIFADGLSELATSVPIYWKCYTEGYFARALDASAAEKVVSDCVAARSLSGGDSIHVGGDFTELQILSTVPAQFTPVAAALGVGGISRVNVTVTEHGEPVGFQIIHAVGAGLDEQSLAAIYQYKFQPATKSGKAIRSDFDLSVNYQAMR